MKETSVLISDIATLVALAKAMIPSDDRDAGAASAHVGPGLAEKMRRGPFGELYIEGLKAVNAISMGDFGREVTQLDSEQLSSVVERLRSNHEPFFRQLRADVCGIYMSDAGVWQRIRFPGPSTNLGGYPDFDQPPTLSPATMQTPPFSNAVQQFLSKPIPMLIDGHWRPASDGQWMVATDPATGMSLGRFAAGTANDAREAVQAAGRAFRGTWKRITPYDRGRLLFKVAALIEKHATELAELITLDNGKPLWEANKEVGTAVSWTEYYAGWTTKLTGETIPVSIPGQFLNFTTREPLGVVAGITPPNYPLTMPLYKAIPALATGNTIVLKPSEDASLVALRLGELFQEAGLPDGVVNIVTGLGEVVGATLADDVEVDKITFTGSTEVGRALVRASAGNLKRVSLELGGKSPNIVFADADLEAALKGVFMGIFFCQGEICSAGSRLFLEESIYEEFTTQLAAMARGVKLGHGLHPETKMGPLVSRSQQQRVLDYVRIGSEENAIALSGGRVPSDELSHGCFVEPTVFANVNNQMRIAREEIFGPVVCAIPFRDLPDAIAKGNDSPFGLAAGVWTRDIRKAHQAASALEVGTVWVNCYNAFDNASPWGGFKQSGWGREKGPYGLELFTQIKSVVINYS
jgi:aldehyde dehydrogenase (NAD+)